MTAALRRGALALMLLGAGAARIDAAPPEWLRTAAVTPAPGAAAVVLVDDHTVIISSGGKMSSVRRFAVRINEQEGRSAAAIREVYVTGSDRVKGIRGWLLRPSAAPRELGGAARLDIALTGNDVYNEVRARVMTATDEVRPGDVFGAEVETESSLLFAQLEWPMQGRWPVLVARRTLTLPAGWRARSVTFNAAPLDGRTQGSSVVWEMRDLKEIPDEEDMPPASDLVPRLAVSVFAAPGQEVPGQFDSWKEVAGWLAALSPARGSGADSIAAKARELTAGAATVLDKVTAIGRFVQRVQYVSIQTGLGRGGGYQPRAADLVLGRNYGDCKDKANLMRALLSAVGIQSYLVSVYSGDRNYVRPEWPSPQQFNHAIIAVSVPDSVRQSSVLAESPVGRLLVFDPTDEFTPLGFLPVHEQGSHALIVDGAAGALVRLPLAPEADHAVTRTVEGKLSDGGSLEAAVVERASGEHAARRRAMVAALEPSQYRQLTERRVAAGLKGGRVVDLAHEAASGSEFVQRLTVAAERYAQPMGSLLLVSVPFELGEAAPRNAAGQRRAPIEVAPRLVDETVRMILPAGVKVDELPAEVKVETPFGRYTLRYSVENGGFIAHRSLQVKRTTVAPADAAALGSFFERVRTADGTPVVLAKR